MKRFLFLVVLVVIQSVQSFGQCGVHCGTERWKVKTLTDTTRVNIDPDEVLKTINWFRTRTRPANLPNTRRLIGIETMTFRVRGKVIAYKREGGAHGDRDFHVVLAQVNHPSKTMVVEFTDPDCARVCSSEFLEQMRQAREDFIEKVGQPTGSFKEPEETIVIEVVGIGFFDRLHGQRGMAPSGIEIHPVLSMRVID
jgi:hypothetical protein